MEVHRTIEIPLEINAKKIKIVLAGIAKDEGFGTQMACPNLEAILRSSPVAEYAVINSNRYELYSFDQNGRKKHEEVRMPVDKSDSEIPDKEAKGAD